MAGETSEAQAMQRRAVEDLRILMRSWYPGFHIQTYCVPPCVIHQVPYARTYFAGQPVLTTEPPPENVPASNQTSNRSPDPAHSTWTRESQRPCSKPATVQQTSTTSRRDDFAQQHVMYCLQKLGQMQLETMFVISGLDYCQTLTNPFSSKAAGLIVPRSVDRKLDPHVQPEIFDVLVIHRFYGILVGEIETVGVAYDDQKGTEGPTDAEVAQRLKEAIQRLDKSENTVNSLAAGLNVRKTLILPYVTSAQLQRVLATDPQLEQEVCRGVGAPDATHAVELCLCADQLSDRGTPWHVPPAVLSQLHDWFTRRMACTADPNMSDDVYLDIVARVVGPATSVAVYCAVPPRLRIQTFIDSTACIEGKLARLVLTPDQLTLLSAGHDLVMLTGPTGTGKTAVLGLKGLQWLREGHDVHIPSTLPSTKASSRLLYYQLQLTLSEDPTMPSTAGKVHLHLFDICNAPGDKERVVNTLASASKDQELFVLMDEIPMTSGDFSQMLHSIIQALRTRVPKLHLWSATPSHMDIPTAMQAFPLTAPFRCTPRILKEVQDALSRTDVAQYSISGTPSPSDGPNIIQLRHQGAGHTGRWPVECFLCGQEVARVLKELHVGETGGDITKGGSKVSDTPLMYRDVFVLTRSSELHDRIFVIPPSRFVSGLRAEGIPVTVLGRPLFCLSMEEWERALVKVVTAQTDEVAVVDYRSIAGLERKVVVLLRGFDEYMDNSLGERGARLFDVVHGFSRCTLQLVVVEVPR